MLADRIETPWIDPFESVLRLCQVTPGLPIGLLGCRPSRCIPPTRPPAAPVRGGTITRDGEPVVAEGRLA